MRTSIFNTEQIEFLVTNYNKMSYKEIAEHLGFTERQVRGKINNLGLTKLRKFNSDYFHNIDSPNKAYWLGFIYADGNIQYRKDTRNYELNIELIDSDGYILQYLNEDLGNKHKIKKRKRDIEFNGYTYQNHTCLLRIFSKEIVEDLMIHNIVPNKTNINIFPVCNEYFFEFLRGFMDGDGCIHLNGTNIKKSQVNFTNSNIDFLNYLEDTIYNLLGITGSVYKEKDKKFRLVYYNNKDVLCLLDNIYKNNKCIKLIRKYDKYISLNGSPT